MVVYGYEVDNVDGNEILIWEVIGCLVIVIIVFMYIFVGVYGQVLNFVWFGMNIF